jgi:hypothetical protein
MSAGLASKHTVDMIHRRMRRIAKHKFAVANVCRAGAKAVCVVDEISPRQKPRHSAPDLNAYSRRTIVELFGTHAISRFSSNLSQYATVFRTGDKA